MREARERLGLTQTEVVGRLRDEGLAISRGHYSNLERGTYEFTDEQRQVLHRVLAVPFEVPAPAAVGVVGARIEPVALTDDYPDDVVRAGRKLNEYLAEADLAWTPESLDDFAGRPDEPPVTEVLTDPEAVQRRLVRLLLDGADRPDGEPILMLGFAGVSLRSGERIGLSKEVRRAIHHALSRGRRCTHVVRTTEDDRNDLRALQSDGERREDAAKFVQVVGQLLRMPNYEAYAVPARKVGTTDAAIVVPGIGAVQFYGGATSGQFEAALFLRDPRTVEVVADHVHQLVKVSKPITHRRIERRSPHLVGPEIDDDELLWEEDVTELAETPCARSFAYLFFPTELWPPEVYADRLDARREASDGAAAGRDRRWRILRDWQAARHESMFEQLELGFPLRVVLPTSTLHSFARTGRWSGPADEDEWMTWPESQRIALLEGIEELFATFPNFEIGLAGARWRRALESVRWAVHDDPAGGVVTVRVTHRGDIGEPEVSRVDMQIRRPEIVQAFAAHFGDLWNHTWDVRTDRRTVRSELGQELDRLGRNDADADL
ncbi:MAG: helix-turn-helix transcriptional regulator [Actinomycetota bacterium]|nr:helix-turn-helix transcriptional regulator [Actinomycetota bacterium]